MYNNAMTEKKDTIQTQLKELEAIAEWFDKGEELDVEEGLAKVKQGADLVKKLKARIRDVENEFREIEADLTEEA
jgi:exonuclease VII small subunit